MRFVQKRAWPLMNLYHKTNIFQSLVDEGKRTRNVKILILGVLLSIPTWVLNVPSGFNHFCPRKHALLFMYSMFTVEAIKQGLVEQFGQKKKQ